ncbi:hypothetical protein Tco_0487239 [Tanacetum coccineum]
MSSLKAKQPKRPPPKRTRNVGKSKRTQLSTSSSTESPPSVNGDLPSTKFSPRSYHRALKDDPNMSKKQRETRGMFKHFGRALHNFARMLKRCRVKNDVLVVFVEICDPRIHQMVDPYVVLVDLWLTRYILSPTVQAPLKSISSKSTHYASSSSPSESPAPTHVAPPPKLRFVIPIKQEPQELPPLQMSPNDPYAQTMDNWPPGPSNPSPPPRVSRPPLGFPNPPPGFKLLTST